MTRRDIIIVAVLINVGLLVTLFISSLKKEERVDLSLSNKKGKEIEVVSSSTPPKNREDQVDQVINQYTALSKVEKKKEEPLPSPVLTPKTKLQEKITKGISQSPLRIVTVEKGDVLEKIARSHGVSVDEIMKLNHLSNSRLQIGQELKLPHPKPPKKEGTPKKKEEGKYYVVKGGDNPWTIAKKNGIQVEELLRLNHMDEEKAKRLRPGDRLRIK